MATGEFQADAKKVPKKFPEEKKMAQSDGTKFLNSGSWFRDSEKNFRIKFRNKENI